MCKGFDYRLFHYRAKNNFFNLNCIRLITEIIDFLLLYFEFFPCNSCILHYLCHSKIN